MRAQYLDRMDLERERGITIKAQAVRLLYEGYELNLIDTPGTSTSPTRCRGRSPPARRDPARRRRAGARGTDPGQLPPRARRGLTIVPVLNKIDLPAAEPEQRADELGKLLDRDPDEILRVSAKSGAGVTELLKTVIDQVPPPVGDAEAPLQALIFDSAFDTYRGVITYVRVQAGRLPSNAKIKMFATHVTSEAEEAGVMAPEATPVDALGPGEVGYLVTGLKDVHQAKVGDTITLAGKAGAAEPLPGYREPKPMVWSGLFPPTAATTATCAKRWTS
jgi:GTP-binding protein LepA